ncbi:MAG: dihydropteroate synthase-like protein [Candidatus Heimdallarchaeota archaeon]
MLQTEDETLNKLNVKQSKLKILLITGKSAEELVKKFAPTNADVIVLPVNVAAFITKKMILENLHKKDTQKYDLIIAPGLIQEDLSDLKDHFGIPVVKGPRYASDIRMALQESDPFSLSPKFAADKFLKESKLAKSKELLQNGFTKTIDQDNEFTIGFQAKLPVGLNRPPLVMAELVDAPKMTLEAMKTRAIYYLRHGANIIDIGAVANNPNPKKIEEIVSCLKELQTKWNFAISIDTLNSEEILSAIDAGVELILSIDHGNIERLKDHIPKEVGVIIVPTNVKEGLLPKTSVERVKSLLTLRDKLHDAGITKIIADPIIEMPIYPGFSNSLAHYIEYRKIDTKTPMMTCIGNVTEFIAADPIGINALFGCIAVELGIQFLLVTDVSVKCRGGIKEVVKGRDMAFIAKQLAAPPKGHGVNILMAKSRTANDLSIIEMDNVENIIIENEDKNLLYNLDYIPDPKGSFTIWIDYHKQLIHVTHLAFKTNKPDLHLTASQAKQLFDEITKRDLVSNIGHAYYLGRELERAEICLYLGKSYVQNEQSFKEEEKIHLEK